MTTPSEALRHRVLEAVRSQPAPARKGWMLPSLGLALLAAIAMWTILQLAGGSAQTDGRPALTGSWLAAGTAALAVVATWLTLPPRRSMLSRPRGVLWAVIIGVPLLVSGWLLFWHFTYEDPYSKVGLRCFALTAAASPWPFLALAYASQRLDPRHPRLAGAALGAASGAWAALLVVRWCPLSAPGHVAFGHVLPIACLALVGALVGSRLDRLDRGA